MYHFMLYSYEDFSIFTLQYNHCVSKCQSLSSHAQFFATPWTVDCQAPPLSMEFSRQQQSGQPVPFPGDLPDQGIEPRSPALQADSLLSEPPGQPPLSNCTIFPSPPEETLCLSKVSPSGASPGPWHHLIYFLFLWICLFWMFPVNGTIRYVAFCVWFFQCNVCKDHPFCRMDQFFIPFYDSIVFYMDMPHFVYLLSIDGHLGLLCGYYE